MFKSIFIYLFILMFASQGFASSFQEYRRYKREKEVKKLQEKFNWWPSDASPAPVKDPSRGGYWWWPKQPGQQTPWGNRGYVYLYKIIFDYQAEEEEPVLESAQPEMIEELPQAPQEPEPKPSLLVKRIHRNVKIYFDYNKADLRAEALPILDDSIASLQKHEESSILITGNCDIRGSQEYNQRLGHKRAQAVQDYMLANSVPEERIKIVSRGKLDAIAPVTDVVGMQKDRNAQFMVADIEEVLMHPSWVPEEEPEEKRKKIEKIDENRYQLQKEIVVETPLKAELKEYTVQRNDSLWKIALSELGSGHRWKYLYELNKERIKNPQKLRVGQKLLIPQE